MDSRKWIGHISMLSAIFCFSLLAPFCKLVYENSSLTGFDMASFRMIGACGLFWLTSLFLPREPVKKGDGKLIFAASLAGTLFSQGLYTFGIQFTSPTNASIIGSFVPIFILILSAAYLKADVGLRRIGGVALSFSGALLLVFGSGKNADGHFTGDAICLVSQMVSACYFTFFGKVIIRYSPITFMKWMFLVGGAGMLLLNGARLWTLDYKEIAVSVRWLVAYIVIIATFAAYQLMFMGQKYLPPHIVGMYLYPQPFITAVFSSLLGLDALSGRKLFAAVLILAGVYVVNRSAVPKRTQEKTH